MIENNPTHLLSSLGVLASFSIAKKINKQELKKITDKIKKIQKTNNPKTSFEQLLINALIQNTKNYISTETPPGLIFPKENKINVIYKNLMEMSEIISIKLLQQDLNKHQLCFILNALANILDINEEDFQRFYKKIQEEIENSGEEIE